MTSLAANVFLQLLPYWDSGAYELVEPSVYNIASQSYVKHIV